MELTVPNTIDADYIVTTVSDHEGIVLVRRIPVIKKIGESHNANRI